jgi:hypothetical protein
MALTDFQLTHKEARMSIAAILASAQVTATGALPATSTTTPQAFVRDQFELWYQFVNGVAIPDETIFTSPPAQTPPATTSPTTIAATATINKAATPTAIQTSAQQQAATILQGLNPATLAALVGALSTAVGVALPQTNPVAGEVAAVANGISPILATALANALASQQATPSVLGLSSGSWAEKTWILISRWKYKSNGWFFVGLRYAKNKSLNQWLAIAKANQSTARKDFLTCHEQDSDDSLRNSFGRADYAYFAVCGSAKFTAKRRNQ